MKLLPGFFLLLVVTSFAVGSGVYFNQRQRVANEKASTELPLTKLQDPSISEQEGHEVLLAEEKLSCGFTASVAEGPYYVSGMPALQNGNLNYSNLPGVPLKVSGYVYDGAEGTKPIPNAVVDIWQADNDGAYHPTALRGFVTTNDQGYYEFTTVYPGEYSGRTRHIHVKIRAEGFPELTTQLIVPSLKGDDVSFDEDSISRGLPECHLLKINDQTSPASSEFDFRIANTEKRD
jgi:protocatechuate 3,4-dioxygenase beta subunit